MAYKSGFERDIDANLRSRKVNFTYEELTLPYVLNGEYHPDFVLKDTGIIVEAKGLLDRESKRKMLAVKRQHPDLDIRFLFMYADKKVPGSRQTHGEWATKNGFKWAEGKVPDEWLEF
jgi:hypothetical protein